MNVPRRSSQMIYCKVEARPKNDDGYFEQMAKAVFRSGFNWQVIEKKWPDIRKAFAGFSIQRVAKFNESDIDRLMEDKGVVRNYRKITAVIDNAKKMMTVQKEYGSFQNYLKAVGSNGEAKLCKTVVKHFSHVGDSMVVSFLRSVGEEIPEMNRQWMEKHLKDRGR